MSATSGAIGIVLEPAARRFAEASADPPYLHQLGPERGRRVLDELQSGNIARPDVDLDDRMVPGGPVGAIRVRVVRPAGAIGRLPVILYLHGAGWVFGNCQTHDRLIRELAVGTGSAVVFPHYSLSPEARYPVAVEECYVVLRWLAGQGAVDLDGERIAVAGDSVGGNLATAVALLAKRRSGPGPVGQVLFYPVTDARFDTASYRLFAEGFHLRRDAMRWFWDQYAPDEAVRAEVTASPLRASVEQLAGLPPALVVTAEADVLRDEGEAYAARLRAAGVPVSATRYQGTIHDFVMLDALRGTEAAEAAINQAVVFLKRALRVA
ncbi:alpha/beta hydrolase [Plantactinospora soyae]|uniref:Acetyl esterase/lipase n=1 Tax=Plantactinospora soyae TaxID=1544732 RepID=A0A927QYJ6_9ACTN|nr:alpha/beta hydrolase [Plantactinospora soyae]MBE1489300.1 acetyl esterase/lipase [Plantactinospora soyae]